MAQRRERHAVTLLVLDGRVVTTGGSVIDFQNSPNSSNVEALSAQRLFRGVRPTTTELAGARTGCVP